MIKSSENDVGRDGSGAHPAKQLRLENIRSHRPGEAAFYEVQTWGPGDRELYFVSEIGRESPFVLDIWKMGLSSGRLSAVTDTPDHYEEHMGISPSERKIAFMSSICCDWNPRDLRTLVAELYLMNLDGTNLVRHTRLNEESRGRYMVIGAGWSPDGREMLLPVRDAQKKNDELWRLTFKGSCG